MRSILTVCTACASLLFANHASAQTYKFVFDPKYSAGVEGAITVQYKQPHDTTVTIASKFDFHGVDAAGLHRFDGNCSMDKPPTEYKWHIHVRWPDRNLSASFDQCSLALTGNHYDPLKACGPNSEFAGTPECTAKVGNYSCTPTTYSVNPLACEQGDLAGKLGSTRTTKWTSHGWTPTFHWTLRVHRNGVSCCTRCAARPRRDSRAPKSRATQTISTQRYMTKWGRRHRNRRKRSIGQTKPRVGDIRAFRKMHICISDACSSIICINSPRHLSHVDFAPILNGRTSAGPAELGSSGAGVSSEPSAALCCTYKHASKLWHRFSGQKCSLHPFRPSLGD